MSHVFVTIPLASASPSAVAIIIIIIKCRFNSLDKFQMILFIWPLGHRWKALQINYPFLLCDWRSAWNKWKKKCERQRRKKKLIIPCAVLSGCIRFPRNAIQHWATCAYGMEWLRRMQIIAAACIQLLNSIRYFFSCPSACQPACLTVWPNWLLLSATEHSQYFFHFYWNSNKNQSHARTHTHTIRGVGIGPCISQSMTQRSKSMLLFDGSLTQTYKTLGVIAMLLSFIVVWRWGCVRWNI